MALSFTSSYTDCWLGRRVSLNGGNSTGFSIRLSTISWSMGIKSSLPEGIATSPSLIRAIFLITIGGSPNL